MAADNELIALYAQLRADVLARHFALGRYFRANHFSQDNSLGAWTSNADSMTCGDVDTQWGLPRSGGASLYRNAVDLITQERDPSRRDAVTHERWRILKHRRENALMMTGQRLIDLSIEHALGHPQAATIISEVLFTLNSLYKFQGDHFDGYIVRWDAATSDWWDIEINGRTGEENPMSACEFLFNGRTNSKERPYSYCTPLRDPERNYERRRWEPSVDELVGLMTGYFMVWKLVEPARGEVTRQVGLIADYLQHYGYLLVRPCGGFANRGASGINPCLEYPFNRVFKRITGRDFPVPYSTPLAPLASDTSFVDALKAARVWDCLSRAMDERGQQGMVLGAAAGTIAGPGRVLALATSIGFPAVLLASPFLPIVLGALAPAAGTGIATASRLGWLLGRASAIYEKRDCFDVADDGMKGEFTLAYLFKWLPPLARLKLWASMPPPPGASAENFWPFIGLTALDDDDPVVRNAYTEWFNASGSRSPDPEVAGGRYSATSAMNFAIAALLQPEGPATVDGQVQEQIQRMFTDLSGDRWGGKPIVVNQGWGAEWDAQTTGKTFEDVQKVALGSQMVVREWHDKNAEPSGFGGYLTSLAMAWLLSNRRGRTQVPDKFPAPPTEFKWPQVVLPKGVIQDTLSHRRGKIIVPRDALPTGTDGSHDLELFQGVGLRHKTDDASVRRPPDAVLLPQHQRLVVEVSAPRWPGTRRAGGTISLTLPPLESIPPDRLRPERRDRYAVARDDQFSQSTTWDGVSVSESFIDNQLSVDVGVSAVTAIEWTGWVPHVTRRHGRFEGDYNLYWRLRH